MRSKIEGSVHPSEDVIRNAQLACGLRALAATLIVGGIVIAALQTEGSSSGAMPIETPSGQVDPNRAAGGVTPTGVPPARQGTRVEPALERLDRAMEQQG